MENFINQLGPYEIIAEIGCGGMGRVYKAYHRQLERFVAIKAMLQGGKQQRFFLEAKTIAKLRHPHIVSLYDIKENMGNFYIVMDYVEGESLAEILQTSLLAPRRTLEIIYKIALAIEFAHRENIIHRDLKPANIVIEKTSKEPIILDFGIAKDIACHNEITQSGEILGTPNYMAPEQVKSEQVFPGTDVYALGAILYEMLTGKRAIDGETPATIMHNVIHQEPVLLCFHNPKLSKDLQTICHRAMEKNPGYRYANALEFSSDIDRFLKGEAISHSASLWYQIKKKLRAYRHVLVAILFLTLGIASLYIYQFYQYQKKASEYLEKANILLKNKNVNKIMTYMRASDFVEKAWLLGKNNQVRQRLYTMRKETGLLALKKKNYLLSHIAFKRLKNIAEPGEIKELLKLVESTKKRIQQKQIQKIHSIMQKVIKTQKEMDLYITDISRMKGKHIVTTLLSYLPNQSRWQRYLSIEVLGKLGDTSTKRNGKDAVEWLLGLLQKIDIKKNAQEAEKIIWALAWLRDARAHKAVDKIRWENPHSIFWDRTAVPYTLIPLPKELTKISKQNISDKKKARKFLERGLAKFFKKDLRGAMADYNQAIAFFPNYALAYANRGSLYRTQKNYKKALENLNKAIELAPTKTFAYINRIMVYRHIKKFSLALKDCHKVLQIRPKFASAYVERGTTKENLGDFLGAIKDFTQAIHINPKLVIAYNCRGVTYDRIQNYPLAIANYSKAMQINPTDTRAYINRGLTLEKQGNISGAIADYTSALRLDPRDASVYSNRGSLWKDMGDYNRALEDLTQAIKLEPGFAMAYNVRSGVYYKKGDIKRALEDCNQAILLDPTRGEFFFNRALLLTDRTHPQQVIANYSKAIQLDPGCVDAYNKRGLLYAELGQHGKAIVDYTIAIKKNSHYVIGYINRGASFFQQKNIKRAIADFSKAIQLDPQEADAYLNRAIAIQAMGKQKLANHDFRTYIKLRPNTPQAQKIKAYLIQNKR